MKSEIGYLCIKSFVVSVLTEFLGGKSPAMSLEVHEFFI
ncbi:MAG: hypothetical protein RL095_3640 [Verrucomicrobiota bacterium]|jgi:hypothetical protein